MFGQVGTLEAHSFVRVRPVVVVPVEKRGRSIGSQTQGVHSEDAADVHFARARQQAVAHHAHDGARHEARASNRLLRIVKVEHPISFVNAEGF